MVEKCLVLATMAVLMCHPRSTIKCFNSSSATSPHRKTSPSSKAPYHNNHARKVKSKEKHQSSSLPKCSCSSNINILSPPVLSSPPTILRLVEKGPSTGIVEKIFQSGWNKRKGFRIENVLKVSPRLGVVARFEKYRKIHKSKSLETSVSFRMQAPTPEGNEVLLRFHATKVSCSLGNNVVSGTCNNKCCGVCRLIESNFSDGERSVSFYNNSWEAHLKLTTDYVAGRTGARKAMIICSVIASHSGRRHGYRSLGAKGCSDTAITSFENQSDVLEDLIVRKPKAVLPWFVLIYNAH